MEERVGKHQKMGKGEEIEAEKYAKAPVSGFASIESPINLRQPLLIAVANS